MTVSQPPSVTDLLSTLSTSLTSAFDSVPEYEAIAPSADGISLLDTKNELLLSYVQNLVFLILLKIRNATIAKGDIAKPTETSNAFIDDEVVKRLVELRVYLEKGVRPLEGRLKYQIDKVIRAASDEARLSSLHDGREPVAKGMADADRGGSDDSDAAGDEDAEGVALAPGSARIDELSFRPNPASFVRPSSPSSRADASAKDGIYRPPRITPTALAPTTAGREEGNSRTTRRPGKSATLDEFVNTELSTAPLAEPSIGSTIQSGGRRSQTQRERDDAARRRTFEEENFMRLPKESKKERAKRGGNKRDAGYGGEDWRGLGEGLDRIERLTGKGKGSALGGRALLERSRKRSLGDGDSRSSRGGAAAGGADVGERFEKRRKMLGTRNRRGGHAS